MNKKIAVATALLAGTVLAGCSSVKNTADYTVGRVEFREQPLVKQVDKGMSKADVLRIGGTPSGTYTRKYRPGTCNNYVLNKDGKEQVYSIGFDSMNRVDSKDFETCESADRA
ncbi:osmotically-inducible lipoprotein OsmE [Pseudomonas sp. 102515]|uniref:osmotically-inducible lipoprotein OsmE n=1 Tax=Pseudomonas sp. 102515 TaxID=3071568 RepID=UPI0028029F24|nr:osmotically-inducible lipoprotein OsmE [Pseudomonas sp. 102515]MDQ7915049.1 osmotically-inducible lipoprotein OsmE [Pseudomonas sp. 102515]